MNDNRNVTRAAATTNSIKQSPMARAVRSVLAASALTLALGATSGTAAAASHKVPVAHVLQLQRAAIDFAPVHDLSLIPGGLGDLEGLEGFLPPGGPVMSLVSGWYGSFPGTVSVINGAAFNVSSAVDDAAGLVVYSTGGNVTVNNLGAGSATGTATAGPYDGTGIIAGAQVGTATVNNAGLAGGYSFGSGDGTGIYANGYAGATVDNTGIAYGIANGDGDGTAIEAFSVYGGTFIDNSGTAFAYAYNGDATAISATSFDGDVGVTNSGGATTFSYYGSATGISAGSKYGDVDVSNSGTVRGYTYIGNNGGMAIGVAANSVYGDVSVANSGDIEGFAWFRGTGIGVYASSNYGTVDVQNAAAGTIYGYSFSGAAVGVYGATRYGDLTVGNDGVITATSIRNAGIGVYASSGYGNIVVANSGDIVATGRAYAAGVTALGHYDVTATNDVGGYIYAHLTSSGTAVGIGATSINVDPYMGSSANVYNDGYVRVVTGIGSGTGISATATGGSGTAYVSNAGVTYVYARAYSATGINAWGDDGVGVVNSGYTVAITPSGNVIGISAFSPYGSAYVYNSGGVQALGNKYGSTGIYAGSQYGAVTVSNAVDGAVFAWNRDADATGIAATSYAGSARVTNDGISSVVAISVNADATGIGAYSHDGIAIVGNYDTGYVRAYSTGGVAVGVEVGSNGGDVFFYNEGDALAESVLDAAAGAVLHSGSGTVTVGNSGVIGATAQSDNAYGVYMVAIGNSASLDNSGQISAYANNGDAIGVRAAAAGTVTVTNSGASGIYATGYENAAGVLAYGQAGVTVDSSANIYAVSTGLMGGEAFGVAAVSLADVNINNSSYIYAYSNSGNAFGIFANAVGGGNATVTNSGGIVAIAPTAGHLADGVFAYGYNATVTNTATGTIDVYGYDSGIGIDVEAVNTATVDNAGAINATAYNIAMGVYATGNAVGVNNSGVIYAGSNTGYSKYAYGISAVATNGDVAVTNAGSGQIVVGVNSSYGKYAYGINAASTNGDVAVTNAGGIYVGQGSLYSKYAYGIRAVSSFGDVQVTNSGVVDAYSFFGYGNGIVATGYGQARVDNLLGGVVDSYGFLSAYGITAMATGPGAAALVFNEGGVYAVSPNQATGISAIGLNPGSTAFVQNGGVVTAQSSTDNAMGISAVADDDAIVLNTATGQVLVTAYYDAIGISAQSFAGNAVVTNAGEVAVDGWRAWGISANSLGGVAYVGNSGEIYATYTAPGGYLGNRAYGISATSTGSYARVNNSGAIDVYMPNGGLAAGVYASSTVDNALVINSGDITTYSTDTGSYGVVAQATAAGAVAYVLNTATGEIDASDYWDEAVGIATLGYSATAHNLGEIHAASYMAEASGVRAVSGYGSVVYNYSTGQILAESYNGDAYGVYANTQVAGTAFVFNHGEIVANAPIGDAYGIAALSAATVYVGNEGFVGAYAYDNAYGIFAAGAGLTQVSNAGDILAEGDDATGVFAMSTGGNASVTNTATGTVTATAYDEAVGLNAAAVAAGTTATVNNAGHVYAHTTSAGGAAAAVMVNHAGNGSGVVNNAATGVIYASGGAAAYGVYAYSALGSTTVNNAGAIHAGGSAYAAAVAFGTSGGTNTLNNLAGGVIEAYGPDGTTWAVLGGDGVDVINNFGTIYGAINLNDGNDVFNNQAGGLWDLNGTLTTAFGDDDTLVNHGVIFNDGAMAFGPGNDTFQNAADGLLWMYGGTVTMAPGATDAFTNWGTVRVTGGGNTIDAGATGTVTNSGLFDFHNDPTTGDSLALGGTLAGTGRMFIDATQNPAAADELHITGNVAATAVQTVDVDITPLFPQTAHISIPFAWVSGNSAAGNFVPGALVSGGVAFNYTTNFIDLGFTIGSDIDTTNVTNDVFSIELDVNGLNDTGTLAAITAQGAANFLNTQVGTFRQRLGVNPYGDSGKVMSAFVRFYTETGDVRPGHTAFNFGQGGHFNYRQATWGQEIGVNANLFSNLHAGLVLGTADSRQQLRDGGVGTNRMDGMTFGAYLTWYVPSGWYVDVNMRKMAADVRSTSLAGTLTTRTHANSWSIEGGYEFKMGNINVVPQLQYTWTQVDEIRPYHGQLVDFHVGGGHYNRARIGVDFNTQIESGDYRWTPYGSLNWVHNERSTGSYDVGNIFYGTTSVGGSSFMAEFGVGVERGGFGFTIGGNWTDGGKYDSVLGGQATFRYSW